MLEEKKPRLEERVVIVTGGDYGIGEAIARDFAREGAMVVLADADFRMQ